MNKWGEDMAIRIRHISNPIRVIVFGLLLINLFSSPQVARADIAPLQYPAGAVLLPGESSTQVRLAAETITFELDKPSPDVPVKARVTADFTMRNLGQTSEKLVVGFPLNCPESPSGMPDSVYASPKIDDLELFVNNSRVATREETFKTPSYLNNFLATWDMFDVTFPPGQDVPIRVTYTSESWGYDPEINFTYVLTTGASWNDTIGSLDIVFRLPYQASDQNINMNYYDTTTGGTPSGYELRWHYDNLEPMEDFTIRMYRPWLWQAALNEEQNVLHDPYDGEAWGRLAMAYRQLVVGYKDIFRYDSGGIALYMQTVDAFQHAIDLQPNDARWHAEYADLIYRFIQSEKWTVSFYDPQNTIGRRELVLVASEIKQALKLDSTNELAINLIQWINMEYPSTFPMIGDQYQFPILSSTAGIYYYLWSPIYSPTTTVVRSNQIATPPPTNIPIATSTAIPATQPASTPSPIYTQMVSPTPSTPTAPAAATSQSPLWIAIPVTFMLSFGLGWYKRRNRL
jgi:hypothetical protein